MPQICSGSGRQSVWRQLSKGFAVVFLTFQSFNMSVPAQALSAEEIAAQAAEILTGKALQLRHLTDKSTVKYDETGRLLGNPGTGDWTQHSHIQVTGVRYRNNTLYIAGNRLGLSFKAWQDGNRIPEYHPTFEEMEIQIKTSTAGTFVLDKQLEKAFLTTREKVPENLPPHWERFVSCTLTPGDDCLHERPMTGVVSGGEKVRPARLKNRKDPSYSSAARQAKLMGQVKLFIIVGTTGRVSYAEVVQPLGLGLEDRAVKAIQDWTFDPGTIDGSPVAFCAEVLVNFSFE